MLDAALAYVNSGFKVFPCCWPNGDHLCGCGRHHEGRDIGKVPLTSSGFKDATQTQAGVQTYWKKWPRANIGVFLEGFYVLDVDADHGGLISLAKLITITGDFKTRTIRTGGGGLHYYLKGTHRTVPAFEGYPGLEIRGTQSAYVIAPPSMHKSGNRYAIESDMPITEPPLLFTEIAGKITPVPDFSINTDGEIPNHQRNITLTRMAGALRRVGFTPDEIAEILLKINKTRCNPPLPESQVIRTAKSVGRYKPSEINPITFKGGSSLEIR